MMPIFATAFLGMLSISILRFIIISRNNCKLHAANNHSHFNSGTLLLIISVLFFCLIRFLIPIAYFQHLNAINYFILN